MRMLRCGITLAFLIVAAPAWAADLSPGVPLGDPDGAFRTPEGASASIAGSEDSPSSLPVGSEGSLTAGPLAGARRFGGTQVAVTDAASMQVVQAAGTAGPAPGAAPVSNPWIFGATLYLWVPFVASTSTNDGLPPVNKHALFNTETHITNLIAGAGELQLSKGDWGIFGAIAGASLGYKGTLLREDSLHPSPEDRTGHFHDSVVSGQYGVSYRLLGRPLDLTTWARGTQPIALDLLAGAQTFYFSSSVNTQREQASASATLTSPLVGARLSWDLADRWTLGFGGRLGGFGVSDTSLTWQADLTVAYRFRMGSVPRRRVARLPRPRVELCHGLL